MKKTLLLAISSFILWSCSNNEQKTSDPATPQAEHHHDHSSVNIELNDGKKWLVNEEMKAPLTKGEELLNEYIKSGQNNYKELAGQLKEQNDKLIESCTMDGKSHEELHKWLHPHLNLVEKLEKVSAEAEAKELVKELQSSYSTYHQYFE